jgi:hypothetical protein
MKLATEKASAVDNGDAPMGYEGLNLNFNRKVLFMYIGFASRTWMSRSHSWKPSAVTSVMPGGRLPCICEREG